MFLLVPAYPGCPGSKAVKRSLLLFHFKTKSLGKLFAYIYLSSIVWYWSVNGQWCPMTRKVMM